LCAVGGARRQDEGWREGETKTLGDLLDANRTASRVPENEWVELVQSMAAGDQAALQAIYARLHRIVFTLIVRITKRVETAEELVVDVFHDVWRRASTYDPAGGSVIGWILNQARSRAIDRLRYEQRQKRAPDPSGAPLPPAQASHPHDAVEVREQGNSLHQALHVLTPEERVAIETAFFSELTYGEVAARLNQPVGTVKTRIRSGLGKLRRALAEPDDP